MASLYYLGGDGRGDTLRSRVARRHGSRGAPAICNPILSRLLLRVLGRARGRFLAPSINHVQSDCRYFLYSPGYGVLTAFCAVLGLYPWSMHMNRCRLTLRWGARMDDKVPSSNSRRRGAQVSRQAS